MRVTVIVERFRAIAIHFAGFSNKSCVEGTFPYFSLHVKTFSSKIAYFDDRRCVQAPQVRKSTDVVRLVSR